MNKKQTNSFSLLKKRTNKLTVATRSLVVRLTMRSRSALVIFCGGALR